MPPKLPPRNKPKAKKYQKRTGMQRTVKYRKPQYANRYNKEVKFLEVGAEVRALASNTGSATNGPTDSLVLMPAIFQSSTAGEKIIQGTDSDGQVIGNWFTIPYPMKSKFTVSYNELTLVNGAFPIIDVVMLTGFVKTTGEKEKCRTDTLAHWQSDCLAAVKRELFDAGYNSVHCSFKELNRRIMIVSKYQVRPRRSQAVQTAMFDSGGEPIDTELQIVSPPNNLTNNHRYPRFKTRLTKLDDGTMVPNSLYLPFTMFYARELDARAGNIEVNCCSKAWYTDA